MSKMLTKKAVIADKLKSFLPAGFENLVSELIVTSKVRFKIVKPRASKLGDFRGSFGEEPSQITVNGDLNPYQFLVTTLHEFAHLRVFNVHHHRVKAHGTEWKVAYRDLILEAIELRLLPSDIESALLESLLRTKASSCSDTQLYMALSAYDTPKEDEVFLHNLSKNSIFALNGRKFKKGDLRRKRYLCEDIDNQRYYLIHSISKVKQIS